MRLHCTFEAKMVNSWLDIVKCILKFISSSIILRYEVANSTSVFGLSDISWTKMRLRFDLSLLFSSNNKVIQTKSLHQSYLKM